LSGVIPPAGTSSGILIYLVGALAGSVYGMQGEDVSVLLIDCFTV
jgi:hypothetical protein